MHLGTGLLFAVIKKPGNENYVVVLPDLFFFNPYLMKKYP